MRKHCLSYMVFVKNRHAKQSHPTIWVWVCSVFPLPALKKTKSHCIPFAFRSLTGLFTTFSILLHCTFCSTFLHIYVVKTIAVNPYNNCARIQKMIQMNILEMLCNMWYNPGGRLREQHEATRRRFMQTYIYEWLKNAMGTESVVLSQGLQQLFASQLSRTTEKVMIATCAWIGYSKKIILCFIGDENGENKY